MGAQEGAALPFFGKLLLLLLLATGRVDALATLHDTGTVLVLFLIKLFNEVIFFVLSEQSQFSLF